MAGGGLAGRDADALAVAAGVAAGVGVVVVVMAAYRFWRGRRHPGAHQPGGDMEKSGLVGGGVGGGAVMVASPGGGSFLLKDGQVAQGGARGGSDPLGRHSLSIPDVTKVTERPHPNGPGPDGPEVMPPSKPAFYTLGRTHPRAQPMGEAPGPQGAPALMTYEERIANALR